ncbi:MAG: bifunctional [glutamine synthetase] adenylyltransferase/[glutamine synthetase]-adenylyl-L-tyrosine phosphorylase [Alphaproteobacteria bacterium]|nr:MAG: bifunctional [glutamine synthetase] adenylyltransferase/[glutamine synthetase]-adenylyl-L-tyrosine phosphorylase [Alphaproteobacteria bacterium]TAF15951.1 MAG: bifunctional [glutamine synthetase] adenylyltransferase/[glutamine synthetase]-adenylyl-L-tyrosine phosphorylase [Alphaproteobacteria bacterium]TAF41932.1 MAG: bifunctional [glutamine synthetase] adenylyltransferase/[glutamine synthetase]-adenylyl-L-tyrosine phosphorylase [Alphaproteobacteria bacterium]TAF76765.1 MAG: bifunctional
MHSAVGDCAFLDVPPHEAAQHMLDAWRLEGAAHPLAPYLDDAGVQRLVHFVAHHSRYLLRLMELQPATFAAFLSGNAESYVQHLYDTLCVQQTEMIPISAGHKKVRIAKQQCSLMIALADITEQWDIVRVTHHLSLFAQTVVGYALEQVYRHALPKTLVRDGVNLSAQSGIAILGMGKLGGRELNYSSDIDLIVFYDPEKLDFLAPPARNRFCVRLVQQLTSYVQDRQEEGYVFRVDLRLRPDPASNSLAVAYDTALRYYEQVGQNWERAAMIKARVIAGDATLGENFLGEIRSFIWRNHLDFAAIDDILSIKRQMQAAEEPEISLLGHNIKTGYGGIREIEFLAQIYQLIWGGRIPALRIKPTCSVLELLVEHGLIDAATNARLHEAYRLFRMVEHRLQMRADQQTHSLPDNEEGLHQLARFCHMSYEEFSYVVLDALTAVHEIFLSAFPDATPLGSDGKLVFTGVEHDGETLHTLRHMGYHHPEAVSFAIQQWHKGNKRCVRTKRAREILTELVPTILSELADTVDPDQAFKRFDVFLDALPVGVQPFSLFARNRALLRMIADITGNAPPLAHMLTSYPQLLDMLVRSQSQGMHLTPELWQEQLFSWLDYARTDDEIIENFLLFKIEQEFLIGVALLEQRISATHASRYFTQLADVMIHAAIRIVHAQLLPKYPHYPTLEFACIALGKHGTHELTLGSDLDIMCVYDVPHGADSEGDVMEYAHYYNRFTTRLMHLLAHPTKYGTLYVMDAKLRPYGAQSSLAVKLESFREYYAASAWLAENMALYQARIIYASAGMETRVRDALYQAHQIPEPAQMIASHIHEIRRKISEQHYSSNPWDIKHVWGGMMDVQWIIKGLLAKHSLQHHLPRDGMTTEEHITWMHEQGIIKEADKMILLESYQLFHTVMMYVRLCHGKELHNEHITEGLKTLLTHATAIKSFTLLHKKLLRLQAQIYHMFKNIAYV